MSGMVVAGVVEVVVVAAVGTGIVITNDVFLKKKTNSNVNANTCIIHIRYVLENIATLG